jgi:hypothetical protein
LISVFLNRNQCSLIATPKIKIALLHSLIAFKTPLKNLSNNKIAPNLTLSCYLIL